MRKFLRKPYILAALAIIVIAVGAFALTRKNSQIPAVYLDKPKQVTTDATKQVESVAPASPPAAQEQNLPVITKPLLSKSSGNVAPVPNKAGIEFTCTGIINATCVLTLTNQADSNDNLQFDAKKIKDDGHGNTSVSWVWEAKPGTWIIKATLSADGYKPNTSDTQTIKVNP